MHPPKSSGRVAAITGASSGIGAELAAQLAAKGMAVGLTARRGGELDAVARAIREAGGVTHAEPADALDRDASRAALCRIADRLGPIDLLVVNAGVGVGTPVRGFAADAFASMVGVNLIAPAAAIEAVLPAMIGRGAGHIVGISSLAAYRGLPGSAGYSATKAGLTALLEGLRPDLCRSGIDVTIVHPGYVRTPMTEHQANRQPFLMDCPTAVRKIVRGIDRRARRVDFPWQTDLLMRIVRHLPGPVFDAVVGRVLLGPVNRGRK